jgi:hypothetical protein
MTDKNIDKAKGRTKEAAGALSAHKRLENEGRADQAKSAVKNAELARARLPLLTGGGLGYTRRGRRGF